ncbi:MAG: hypothetical protein LM590_12825 [Thermofilum sp.]|jgi:hypothetical protein|nr:hypothetical protein [Thermofilum sp.]
MPEQDFYERGLVLLKGYSELLLASQVLGLLALIIIIPVLLSFPAVFTTHFPGNYPSTLAVLQRLWGSMVALALFGLLALAGAILSLVAVYGRLIPAGENLARWREALASPSKLIKYGYWAALGLGILAVIVLAASLAPILGRIPSVVQGSRIGAGDSVVVHLLFGLVGALLVAILAAIAALIGWIGEVMLLFELSSQTGIAGFKTAGVLLILALLVSFISATPYLAIAASLISPALLIAALVVIRENAVKALSMRPAGGATAASQGRQ